MRSAILAIAHALERPSDELGPGRPASHAINLTDGSAGTALLFAYLSTASARLPGLGDPVRWSAAAAAHIDHAASRAATIGLSPGLSAGICGVAWAMVHVAGLLELEVEIPASLDADLIELVSADAAFAELDLISGLIGIGVYFLERLPDPRAGRGLCEIVDRLAERAVHAADGTAWHTPPHRLVGERRASCPDGYFDLGLAHGLAGVIAFLASVHAAGLAVPRSRELLEGAVAWLFARAAADGWADGVPWAHVPGVPARPARLAWCYGDPGVAIGVTRAGVALDRPAWTRWAHACVIHAQRRPPDASGVIDACLCHGSAGLLHILHRMNHHTPDAALDQGLRHWRDWTLRARDRDGRPSVAGFSALARTDGQPAWIAERGLLNGAAGIGLALLATICDVAPDWDRALLLSARTPEAA